MKKELQKVKRIYALDNGRGTMAAFYVDYGAKDPTPKPLMDKDGEPSGFARMKDGTYRIGKQLYTMGARDFKDVEEIHLNIKEMPDGKDDLQVEYESAWLRKIKTDNEALFSDGAEEVWIIGCPTGWRKKSTIDKYRRIFEKAGFKNVIIVPESNAAMMFAQQTFEAFGRGDKKTGALCMDPGTYSAGVLCIDLGAYSADTTYIRPGKVASHGGYVGASLIERMILAMNLSGEFCEDSNNREEVREAVRRFCETDADFQTHLLLQSKKLKETYFTNSADGADYSDGEVCSQSVSLQFGDVTHNDVGARRFELVVTDEMATAITRERSVKSVLGKEFNTLPEEVRNSLGDKTWEESLRAFVEDTLAICPEFERAAKGKGTRPNLILTGGASLMPFVHETLRGMLPNIHLRADREPMSTIAKGLAYFGPDKLKAIEFDRQFEYIATHDSDGQRTSVDESVINKVFAKAHGIIGNALIDGTIERMTSFLNEAIDLWEDRNWWATEGKGIKGFFEGRNVKGHEIVPIARKDFEEWFNGNEIEKVFDKAVKAAKKHVADEINSSFSDLCKKFHLGEKLINASTLNLSYADNLLSWFKGKFYVFDNALEARHDEFSNLENPGFWDENFNIFSKTRAEIRNEYATEWQEEIDKLRNELTKMLGSEFDSNELYAPFIEECMKGLKKSLNDAKQMRLGELVVEDPFDESGDHSSVADDTVNTAKAQRSVHSATKKGRRISR